MAGTKGDFLVTYSCADVSGSRRINGDCMIEISGNESNVPAIERKDLDEVRRCIRDSLIRNFSSWNFGDVVIHNIIPIPLYHPSPYIKDKND